MINVLVVDDSLVVRDLLVYILNLDPDINVIGTAESGEKALQAIENRKLDVITMDIQMPGMDGLETTRRILELKPVPIVIVTAVLDPKCVETSFQVMKTGAVSMVEKPPGLDHPQFKQKAKELVDTIKTMSEIKVIRRYKQKDSRGSHSQQQIWYDTTPRLSYFPPRIVAIGASTGGPPVLQIILSLLPKYFPVSIVIVQHIAEGFLQGFVDWLSQTSQLPIHIPRHGDYLKPGNVYLAPAGFQMGINSRNQVILCNGHPQENMRPAVSHLFQSVAEVFGRHAVGILLTGMGKDGACDLLRLKELGAVTIIQQQESCVVFGMPGEAQKLGAAIFELPPEKIAEKLVQLTLHREDNHGGKR